MSSYKKQVTFFCSLALSLAGSVGLPLHALSKNDKTLLDWQAFPELTKNTAANLTRQADEQVLHGDVELAIATFTNALKINSKFGPAYHGRAHAEMELDKMQSAISDFTRGMECGDRSSIYCQRDRAELNLALNNYVAAKKDYDELVKKCPNWFSSRIGRAHCFIALNQPELAIAECNLGLKIKGEKNFAVRERALAYIAAHQYKNALADYTKMIARSKLGDVTITDNSMLYNERAALYDKLGNKEMADKDRKSAAAVAKETFDLMPFSAGPGDLGK